jgi:DNA/RNA endonuclease G (NUC1)
MSDTFYCVNTAPQDKYINHIPWRKVEQQALIAARLAGEGYVVTGTTRFLLDIDGASVNPKPPISWTPLGFPRGRILFVF